ncbi:MAG: beta-xylosidase [Caulobacteraceae bacterium]|nr:MAG: beta-xylosidase [Caulobacteraceae bacterium]
MASAGQALAQTPPRVLSIDANAPTTPRDRFADLSIGADYPGTTMREDSLGQLRLARDELGFRYIRMHGIFHDDLNVYREVDGRPVYDFDRIDRMYDRFLAMGIKPFVELGFTPDAMKTSDQTIFYWKGNTSHPAPEKWDGLVDAFVRHLIARYGAEEVRTWFFEVWNEPNLAGFWEKADKPAYFDLYVRTARVIKAIDPALKVGGPATAGADWVPEFLANAKATNTPVDFVATHTYGVDGGFLDEKGEQDQKLSPNPDSVIGDVRRVREQIEASAFPGLPLYFTEWSSSYNPRDPVHDSPIGAAYVLTKLKQVEGLAQGMSYWTYSDLFEEPGEQTRPYDGGFGLMTPDGIRKATWFAYRYLNALGDAELATGDTQSIATRKNGSVQVLAWNYAAPDQTVSNRPYFRAVQPSQPTAPLNVTLSGLTPGPHAVSLRRTGFRHNDAYTAYLEMGRAERLTPAQRETLQDLTQDAPEHTTVTADAGGHATLTVPMNTYDVVLIEMETAR